MKKRILIFSISAVLIATAVVFYACNKEEKNNENEGNAKNLKKEAEFVAKIDKEVCVNVEVFRDENGNAQIVTTNVANDPELAMGFMVPKALSMKLNQAKSDDAGFVLEVPSDAIYWLVPLDGNEPVKFEPTSNGAKDVSGNKVTVSCECAECMTTMGSNPHEYDNQCTLHQSTTTNGVYFTCKKQPGTGAGCTENGCKVKTLSSSTSGTSQNSTSLFGSCYLLQSNSLSFNGNVYN